MQVTWQAVEGATAYEVWRAPNLDSNGVLLKGTNTLEQSSFKDFEAVFQTHYVYRVRALNASGASEFSEPAEVKAGNTRTDEKIARCIRQVDWWQIPHRPSPQELVKILMENGRPLDEAIDIVFREKNELWQIASVDVTFPNTAWWGGSVG